MAKTFDAHLQAAGGAQLRNFGYKTEATEAALFAITAGNVNGEIRYVTSTGCLYQWNPLENGGAGRWVKWNDTTKSSWKQAVRVAETAANVTLATPGATIDGVTLVAGDRVLLAGQTDPIENGIYIFDTAATPLVRAEDLDDVGEADGASVLVEEGTNADSQYQQTADDVTPGTDAQAWAKIGPATGVASATEVAEGTVELATTAEVITGTDTTRAVTPAGLAAVIGDRGGSAQFGDGSAQSFTIPHGVTGLAGSDRLVTQVTVVATGFAVEADVTNDASDITITTLSTPATNAYEVTWWFAG